MSEERICRRCRKPAPEAVIARQNTKPDGWISSTFDMYHMRCIPPAWWHQLAGSLPASRQLPTEVSLSQTARLSWGAVNSKIVVRFIANIPYAYQSLTTIGTARAGTVKADCD